MLEKILAADPGGVYPVCLAGEGACPPEDCGGAWDTKLSGRCRWIPATRSTTRLLEWLELETAAKFDPEAFDIAAVNETLAYANAIR